MAPQRFFVEKINAIVPNKESGMVKLTFGVSDEGKDEDVVQLIVNAGDLNKIFQTVSQKMQSTFGGGGGPGGPGGGQRRPPGQGGGGGKPPYAGYKDLTRD